MWVTVYEKKDGWTDRQTDRRERYVYKIGNGVKYKTLFFCFILLLPKRGMMMMMMMFVKFVKILHNKHTHTHTQQKFVGISYIKKEEKKRKKKRKGKIH